MTHIFSPVQEAYLKRRDMQNEETKILLKKKQNIDFHTFNLNEIKRKRPKLSRGDVFVLNPFYDIYFFGVVLDAGINAASYGKNLTSVCILKRYMHGLNLKQEILSVKEEDLLLKPKIVTKSYWYDGYFYNIGINIGDYIDFDYGFYDCIEKGYVNEYRIKCDDIPQVKCDYALTTMIGIVSHLYDELIIDNSFMAEADRKLFLMHLEEAANYEPPPKELSEFDKSILPFEFSKENKRRFAVMLTNFSEYKSIFTERSEELEGNGYDWEDLVKYFIKENFAENRKKIHFDSEAGMFYMYCSDENLLKEILNKLLNELHKEKLKKYVENAKFSDL